MVKKMILGREKRQNQWHPAQNEAEPPAAAYIETRLRAQPIPRVTFHRGKVTKARRGPSP